MMFHVSSAFVAALALTAGPSLTSAALITIDDFATPTGTYPFPTAGAVSVAQNAPGAIGGRRELEVTRDTGVIPAFDKVTVTHYSASGTSFLDFDSTSGADGTLDLVYDGPTGNLNADLSGNRKLEIALSQFNPGEASSMPVRVDLFDGVSTVSLTTSTSGVGGQTLEFDFSPSTFNTLDFASVDSIRISFQPGLAADFRVISILAAETVIPEPAGVLLAGVGTVALLARRRLNSR